MKARITGIDKDRNRIDVTTGCANYGLDTHGKPELCETLKRGEIVEVERRPNNPFVVLAEPQN